MATMVIDTLGIYERLKDADLTEKAAKEIAEVFRENIEERLATKSDLEIVRSDIEVVRKNLEESLARTRAETVSEIVKWVAGMLIAQSAATVALVKLL